MAFTPIVVGSLAWGGPVNAAFTSQDARITELENQGALSAAPMTFTAMNMLPEFATATTPLVSGTVYMMRIDIAAPLTFNTITTATIAGATVTAGQNFAGLYNSAGTLVAVTADQTTPWTAGGGEKNMALTAPYAAAAGTYYVAYLSNGATPLTPVRAVANSNVNVFINHGLTVSNARWTTGPTAQTTLPASITMASRTLSGTAYFAALS